MSDRDQIIEAFEFGWNAKINGWPEMRFRSAFRSSGDLHAAQMAGWEAAQEALDLKHKRALEYAVKGERDA